MSVDVYTPDELPREHQFSVKEMGHDRNEYSFIAVGMYDHGHDMLEELFGSAHIVSEKSEYDDEPAVYHYALIGLKKK